MTAPHPTSPVVDRMRDATARSTAARLLRGAGRAGVVAYREDPDHAHPVLSHGLTAADLLVLTLPAGSLDPATSCREVRLRLDQQAADPRVRVSTASLHALAHLRLMDEDEVSAMSGLGLLPTEVRWSADAGAQVALLCLDRLLLHDPAGVTPLSFADVVEPPCFPTRDQEWLCRDTVEQLGAEGTRTVVDAVVEGRQDGIVGPQRPTPASMSGLAGQTVLADVDGAGCTWLQVDTAGGTRTVFVPFPTTARCPEDLERAVDQLAQLAV
ncbi:hypothetical protein [Serinicoccus sediminis]|uniref:hypothetical protein n=1 Tax=Serinicoccus sediminis TaxID=2306021 RepID=UPI00101EB2A4|nr:hypothetical protein [Serinicoccus sediminis]